MAFKPTDLPEPVVPATSRCGILAIFTTTGLPPISLPNAMGKGNVLASNSAERNNSARKIISRWALGISKPMHDLPGITSTTRTLITDSERAKSLAKPEILLALIPGAGCSSKRVMTGPG